MTDNEFIRQVKKLGKERGVTVQFVARRGKGSHGTLFYGAQFTIVSNTTLSELEFGEAVLREQVQFEQFSECGTAQPFADAAMHLG